MQQMAQRIKDVIDSASTNQDLIYNMSDISL